MSIMQLVERALVFCSLIELNNITADDGEIAVDEAIRWNITTQRNINEQDGKDKATTDELEFN